MRRKRYLKSMAPDISMFVPCYKRWEYTLMFLQHHVELLKKEPFTFEVILIDDGNTQEYLEKCINPFLGDYSNFRIQCLHQGHRGLRSAVLLGIRACTGEFIQKNDNDCLLPEGWFTFATKILDKVDAISPAVSQSNAKNLLLEKDKRPFRPARFLGGVWLTTASKLAPVKRLTSAGGNGIWGGNVLSESPLIKTFGWSTQFVAQDVGYRGGSHRYHIKSEEHRKYSREVGRKVNW